MVTHRPAMGGTHGNARERLGERFKCLISFKVTLGNASSARTYTRDASLTHANTHDTHPRAYVRSVPSVTMRYLVKKQSVKWGLKRSPKRSQAFPAGWIRSPRVVCHG
jgi:hypothetical protein